jgi:NAD(P)-dependent dehydrogenase (short-subunit alcohol dehydrogenase family)
MSLLSGTAYITGGGSGIGQATAMAFARHGIDNVAIADIRAEALQETVDILKEKYPHVEVEAILMDASSEDDINDAVARVVKRFGRLDIALNNAGMAGPLEGSAKIELDGWRRVMDLNINGVFLCQRAELRQMLTQE